MQSRQILYAMASCFLLTVILLVGCGGGSSQSGQPVPVQSVVAFSSHPSTAANEADLYSYTPTATDTANGTITFALTQAPDGATLSGDTLNWTPTSAQSRLANAFTMTATSSAGGSAQQTWSVTPTGVIHGQQIVTWHKSDGSTVDLPNDLTSVPISVVIAGANSFTTLAGTGLSDGTFTVPKVPGGSYLLRFYDEVFSLSKSSVDLSFHRSGRPDVSVATNLPRHYQLGALDPWQSTDDVTMYSNSIDTVVFRLGGSLIPGDTNIDVTINSSWNMLDSSKGDTAYMTQMVTNYYPNVIAANYLAKSYAIGGLTEVDGQTTLIGGPGESFTDVSPIGSFATHVNGSSFAALRSQTNPNGSVFHTGFFLDALPFGTGKGWFGTTPDLIQYVGPSLDDDEDAVLGYGDPFDSNWPLAFAFVDWTMVTYNVPGAGVTTDKDGHTSVYGIPTTSNVISPLISPVRAPAINAQNFFADQGLNDLTPTISWTAPSTGTASEYIVQICKWQAAAGGGYGCGQYATQVARVHTKATSVRIPPGILESGSSYFLTITSRVQTGVDLESAPYASAFPYGEAQALSGVISVVASARAQSRVQSRAVSPRLRERIIPPEVNARFHHI